MRKRYGRRHFGPRLITLARAAKRRPLDNANQPAEPSQSEADRADMEVFLGHMLGMLPVLGGHAFEKAQCMSTPVAAPVLSVPVASAAAPPEPMTGVPAEPL